MFEERKRGTWTYTWAGIVLIACILIAAIWIIRVNPPGQPAASSEPNIVWTEGQILQGVAEVPASGYLSYPLNLNRKATLKAFYTTGRDDRRVAAWVIRAEDFNMWKSGENVQRLVFTGPVPRASVTRVVEPGSYLFLIDNRSGGEKVTLTETDVKVD